MRVLITGGNGKVGRVVCDHFVARGFDVRMLDLAAETDIHGVEYIPGDIMDYDTLREAVRSCEAVVHLAAIPTPSTAPGPTVFQVNAAGTFNVFEAAAAEGIRRIAQASSINAFGCAWGSTQIMAKYFPIDEEHPTYTSDPYSFSKGVIEDIGAYYWRRDGISSVSLRLPWVFAGQSEYMKKFRSRLVATRAVVDEFAALPTDERQTQLDEVRQWTENYRAQRRIEYPKSELRIDNPDFKDKPFLRIYTFDRFNFWAIVDARDAAQAFEKGLTADYEGSHPLFINTTQNWLNYDIEALVPLFFPEVTQWKKPVSGPESLISMEKARQLIGFEPEYSAASCFGGEIE